MGRPHRHRRRRRRLLYFQLDLDDALVPHFGAYSLGMLYMPVVVVVFVAATSGAVITDGMDGLMAGVSAFAYAAYGAIALGQGQEALGAFAFSVAGAAAAFLWFNANPAQVFMGEVGAQALAVGLVILAFMTGWWLLLPVIGIVFMAEGLSDVIQIGYFKLRRHARLPHGADSLPLPARRLGGDAGCDALLARWHARRVRGHRARACRMS